MTFLQSNKILLSSSPASRSRKGEEGERVMGGIASLEQQEEVLKDLVAFVHRVALNEKASPAEIAALPEIAKILIMAMPGNL